MQLWKLRWTYKNDEAIWIEKSGQPDKGSMWILQLHRTAPHLETLASAIGMGNGDMLFIKRKVERRDRYPTGSNQAE